MSTTDPSPSPGTVPGGDARPADRPGLDQVFDGGSLYALRSAVAAHAAAAGLSRSQVYDVVAAAHELAANAIRHGAGNGRLRLLADGRMLHCQVSDEGSAADGPPWPVEHGHGLWIVDQVAERFTIDRGPAGTTATASFPLGR